MKSSIFAILISVSIMMFPSCNKVKGEGPVVTQNRITPDFSALSFSMSGEINVT